MNPKNSLVPAEKITQAILLIRGEKVMLDADLAKLYGVTTKALNQAVKRNLERFPDAFMFKLTKAEKTEVVTTCYHLENLKFSPTLPNAFTEHGVLMLAAVLNSPTAIAASIQIVKSFVQLRRFLAGHAELAAKLSALEQKYDKQFKLVFDAIRQLMTEPDPLPEPPKNPMGFRNR